MKLLKETGIVRKIDELGRIVLPKEIRKTLGIKDGEDLEIFLKESGIYLQKYSRLLSIQDVASLLCQLSLDTMGLKLMFTDCEKIIASYDKQFLNRKIDEMLNRVLESRESYESSLKENFFGQECYGYVLPINMSGDVIGLVLLCSEQPFLSYMKDFAKFLMQILVNKIDIL